MATTAARNCSVNHLQLLKAGQWLRVSLNTHLNNLSKSHPYLMNRTRCRVEKNPRTKSGGVLASVHIHVALNMQCTSTCLVTGNFYVNFACVMWIVGAGTDSDTSSEELPSSLHADEGQNTSKSKLYCFMCFCYWIVCMYLMHRFV